MTLADDLKPLANSIRAIPGQLGIRPYTVEIVLRHWTGTHVGDGTRSETATAITEAGGQPPKVRFLNGEERALLGVAHAVVEIGPITPDFATGGTSIETLTGLAFSPQDHDEILYRLTGPGFPDGQLFRIRDISSDRALQYRVQVEPIAEI